MNELKPEDVMRALELHADYATDNCFECPYEKYLSKADWNCVHHLSMDALALLREKDAEIERLQEIADAVADSFPVCEGCKGKTELGERTEDCVYEIDGTFCAQRAMKMWFELRAENEELHNEIERLTAQIEHCDACDRIGLTHTEHMYCIKQAKSEAITEFAKRMEKSITAQVNVSSNKMLAALMWCLDLVKNVEKELKGETDVETDL